MVKLLQRIGCIGVLALMLAAPAGAQGLRVGVYPSNPPWEFKNEAGSFEGFEVEVAREIAKRLGRDVAFQDLGFQALFAAISSGRIDLAVSSIAVNAERLKNQGFTQPYYDGDGAIVGQQSSAISALTGLQGKTIGAIAATTGEAWLKQNAEKYGLAEIKSYSALQDLLLDVQNGRLDGGVGEIAGFQYAILKLPKLKILLRIPTGERFAMMGKKGNPLLVQVNDMISAMKTDGTMAAIHKKWFGVDPESGASTVTVMALPTP